MAGSHSNGSIDTVSSVSEPSVWRHTKFDRTSLLERDSLKLHGHLVDAAAAVVRSVCLTSKYSTIDPCTFLYSGTTRRQDSQDIVGSHG